LYTAASDGEILGSFEWGVLDLFEPRIGRYEGAPRPYAKTLKAIDQ